MARGAQALGSSFFSIRLSRSKRAHHLADRAGGHARIERRRVELRVAKRPRVIMLTFYVIEIEGSVEPD